MFSPITFLPMRLLKQERWSRTAGAGEIVKEKAHQIEHRGGLENHGPAAGLDFARIARGVGLAAGAVGQHFADSTCAMSGELALAQPEESVSRMVMENSARVWRWAAKRPLELASAMTEAPVEKIPAAVCSCFAAMAHDFGDGAGAIARRGSGGLGEIARDLRDISAGRAWAAGRDLSAGCAPARRRRRPRGAAIRRRSCWWWRARCGRRRRCARKR